MPRIFIPAGQFDGCGATVYGTDHLHLARVLRARPGDSVELLDNLGRAFAASVLSIERNCTHLRIEGAASVKPEPATRITVAQALGKADKFEQVVQHGTEAGASGFIPVEADRCVVQLHAAKDRSTEKLVRWSQIAREAAQQCGRCRIPEVAPIERSIDLFRPEEGCGKKDASSPCSGLRLLLHTGTGSTPIRAVLDAFTNRPDEVKIAIGPEGGWSPEEVKAAVAAGWIVTAIGPFVLRTETAALVAISRIMHCFES